MWPRGFTAGPEDRAAALVLSALAGLRPRTLLPVAVLARSAAACLALVARGEIGSPQDRRFARILRPERIAASLERCGARAVWWDDPDYPPQLRTIHDPPFLLYVRGGPLPELARAVGVVGARRCSTAGRELARALGRGLGQAGVCVVSGAAAGIDAASHEGALSAGGSTVAVLGGGIDGVGTGARRRLVERIAGAGAVVSEYPPGTPPTGFRFPARNRIIAGLCRATVVVQGADRSGSLITGTHALEFGRDVFAVPGAPTDPLAAVPLRLIREGATMIRGPEDLLEDLGLEADAAPPPVLAPMELAALRALSGPTLPEHVARELGVGLGDALGVLVGLELRGLVRGVGGRFEPTLAAVPALAASQHAASDGPPAAGAEERPPRGVGVT
jgi:DNA processing protein